MAKPKTHTGIVVRADGEKRVKLHMSATAWVATPKEFFTTGILDGAAAGMDERGCCWTPSSQSKSWPLESS